MTHDWSRSKNWRRTCAALLICAPLACGCTKPATPTTVLPVSLHGVNYSAEAFSYVVEDPLNAKNTGGGELIDPFAAGGTNCCYELPKKWRAGLKLRVKTTHWLGKAADDSLHDVATIHEVEIPAYPNEKPGELWILRGTDGNVTVISSDFQPDHPAWPGKVKGWPVPSLAYQRARWNLYIDHEKGGVRLYERLLLELEKSPDQRATADWNYSMGRDRKSLEGFTGPDDIKFRAKLREEYEEGLRGSRQKVQQLEKGRP